MEVRFKVQRYDPEGDERPHYQNYTISLPERSTVLDGLMKIKDELDGTLSFRRACRAAICGSCGVRINGLCRLACKTQVAPLLNSTSEVLVEPLANMPITKDLVVDMDLFWKKLRSIKPWLISDEAALSLDRENLMSNRKARELEEVSTCVLCACCYAACPVVTTHPEYIGPSALNKAFRFLSDPRDIADKERLKLVDSENKTWRCHTIFNCVDSCPKRIPITSSIQEMKKQAMLRKLRFWERS